MGVGKTVYKGEVETGVFAWFLHRTAVSSVGASLLAKEVNDDEGCQDDSGALASFASKLAPTDFLALKLTQNDGIHLQDSERALCFCD